MAEYLCDTCQLKRDSIPSEICIYRIKYIGKIERDHSKSPEEQCEHYDGMGFPLLKNQAGDALKKIIKKISVENTDCSICGCRISAGNAVHVNGICKDCYHDELMVKVFKDDTYDDEGDDE